MTTTTAVNSSFNLLFTTYYGRLCMYAESFVDNSQIAEDLVQDVFVNIWLKREDLPFDDQLKPYLYKSVHNTCIQYLRGRINMERNHFRIENKLLEGELIPPALYLFPDDPIQRKEIQDLYKQALDSLSLKTRTIFLLSREQGMKNSEIAKQMGISLKTVEYHISRALSIFRIVMKDYYFFMIFVVLPLYCTKYVPCA